MYCYIFYVVVTSEYPESGCFSVDAFIYCFSRK